MSAPRRQLPRCRTACRELASTGGCRTADPREGADAAYGDCPRTGTVRPAGPTFDEIADAFGDLGTMIFLYLETADLLTPEYALLEEFGVMVHSMEDEMRRLP